MRISKDGDVRKQEILAAALELFFEKGYEETTVNDIIERVGVSKGAFYYYFKAKNEVLDAVIEGQAGPLFERFSALVNDASLGAVDKLHRVIDESMKFKSLHMEQLLRISAILDLDSNIRLKHGIRERIAEKTRPLMQQLVRQGAREGAFATPFPDEAAALYMEVANIFKTETARLVREATNAESGERRACLKLIRQKLQFFEDAIERILGAPKGTLALANPLLKTIETYLKSKQQ